jgi:cob(I)alamin adenosyltransferase
LLELFPGGEAVRYGTGDTGWTSLFSGEKVPKYDTRLDLVGTLDEATCFIGMARAHLAAPEAEALVSIQEALYLLMAEAAADAQASEKFGFSIGEDHLARLEGALETYLGRVELPNKFVLPGGCKESAFLDVARTVVRRAERLAVLAKEQGFVDNPVFLSYLNRVSTLLYVLARYEEAKRGLGFVTLRHSKGRTATRIQRSRPDEEEKR